MSDHDQRVKVVLREFLPEFVDLLRPEWATRFDWPSTEWLTQELFPDPPEGERRLIDLLARISLHDLGPVLIHIEADSSDSLTSLRERLPRYHDFLSYRHAIPVVSLALYLSVGLEGQGWDETSELFLGDTLGTTRWPYLGLPALQATDYVEGANILGVALVGLMRVPEELKPAIKARALLRLAQANLGPYRTYLLMAMVEAYMPLDAPLIHQYQEILQSREYLPVIKMAETTYERGERAGFRQLVRDQLEIKFGPISDKARERLEALTTDQLRELGKQILQDKSLTDLGLEDLPSS